MAVEGVEAEIRFCGVSRCCIPLESHGSGVVCTCPGMGQCSPPPPVAIALGSSVDALCCGSFQLKSSDCASQLENDHWNDSCFCFFGSVEKSLKLAYLFCHMSFDTTQIPPLSQTGIEPSTIFNIVLNSRYCFKY